MFYKHGLHFLLRALSKLNLFLILAFRNDHLPGVVVQTCNFSLLEAEARGGLSFREASCCVDTLSKQTEEQTFTYSVVSEWWCFNRISARQTQGLS
jgi:hypothetical protein